MAKIVAVTGGIGSGKSEVCSLFIELGVPVVDLDQIAHAMSAPNSPAMQQVRQQFGDAMFEADGTLNRRAMRERVFSDPAALEQLNHIMHPAIRSEAVRQLASHQAAPYVVLAIPLLAESHEDWRMIDHVLVVDCAEETQLQRVMQRSGLSAEMARAMMAAQSTRAARLALADTVLQNEESLEQLAQNVLVFHKNFVKTCQ